MKTALSFLDMLRRIIFTLLFLFFSLLTLTVLLTYEDDSQFIVISIFAVLSFLSFLASRKKKTEPSKYNLDVPEEILDDMKVHTSIVDVDNTVRILNDCVKIVKASKNIDVVMSRLELAQRHSYFLKQLEMVKKYKGKPTADNYLNLFVGSADGIIIGAIQRSYEDMMEKSSLLKTESGKQNRIDKYFNSLEEYDHIFSETVKDYIDILKVQGDPLSV